MQTYNFSWRKRDTNTLSVISITVVTMDILTALGHYKIMEGVQPNVQVFFWQEGLRRILFALCKLYRTIYTYTIQEYKVNRRDSMSNRNSYTYFATRGRAITNKCITPIAIYVKTKVCVYVYF